MVKIRMKRIGTKKKPFYRIVVADSRFPRDGKFIEELGTYDPTTDPVTFSANGERVKHWVSRGAQCTDTVRALLKKNSVLEQD